MTDRGQPHQLQVHPQRRYGQETDIKQGSQGPSASKVLAVLTLLPIGGTLLTISCITLAGTLIGLALSFPLFIIFSPVLVPATIVIGLAVAAILTSGVFGLTALSSLSWLVKYLRQVTGFTGEYKEEAKRKMQEMAEYVGQKTKDVGQEIQTKPQDQGRRT